MYVMCMLIAGSSFISIIHETRESFNHYMMKVCKRYYLHCIMFFFFNLGGNHLWPRGTIYGAMDGPRGTIHSVVNGPKGRSAVVMDGPGGKNVHTV